MAKGIGIILMVIGHANMPYVKDYIYMFHMPLFFVLSGYCFKEKYLDDFKTFVNRRLSGLYLPFLKWGLFFLFFHNVLFHLNIYNAYYGYAGNVSQLYSPMEFLQHGIGCGLFWYSEQLLGGYWFLVQLFWASLIGFSVIYFVKKPIVGTIILLVACLLFKYFLNITIPYTGIGSITFLSASFFVFGYAIRKNDFKINSAICLCLFIAVAVGSIYWNTTMQDFNFQQIIPYAITAILGSLMIMGISNKLSDSFNGKLEPYKNLIIFAGDNSLMILTWHFLSFKIVSLLIIAIEGLPIEMLAMFPVIDTDNLLYHSFYVIAGVAMPLLGVCLFNRFSYSFKQLKLIFPGR